MEKNKAKKNKTNQFTKKLLICGDNLKALDDLKKQGIKVDLIYLDPPFFSNRHYEVVWGDEAEVRSFKVSLTLEESLYGRDSRGHRKAIANK